MTEIISKDFWSMLDVYRFSRCKEIFFIYNEITQYEPLVCQLETFKNNQVGQIYLQNEYFKFLRNVFAHFSFFDRYNDVWISKLIVNWNKKGQSIDKFLRKYSDCEPIKYRIWNSEKKLMTYLNINFPKKCSDESRIYLKDLSKEKEGILFSTNCMWRVLKTQIERVELSVDN